MQKDLPKRYRISIPLDDASAIEWMNCQHSLSLSIRQLVKAAIEVNGMRDYFASDLGEVVQKPRRGRPPKVENIEVENQKEIIVREKPVYVDPVVRVEQEEILPEKETIQSRIAKMQGIMNK